mmetsp:Transcript_250/g.1994  ORF Transcript_250/g.1994 Transcript_250/m.1994 type:complete len:430 (-) Transcript_250:4-1293(-)
MISATAASPPPLSASTTIAPSQLIVPAEVVDPASLITGIDSPVKELSFTVLLPLTTLPSTGILSPGNTTTRSPGTMVDTGTSLQESSWMLSTELGCPMRMRAFGGRRPSRSAISDDDRSLACSSTPRPVSTMASSMTGSSKNVGHPNPGIIRAATDMPNDANVPRVTREFMLGLRFHKDLIPSRMVFLPGPRMDATARQAVIGPDVKDLTSAGGCAMAALAACPATQTNASPQAMATFLVLSRSFRILASRFSFAFSTEVIMFSPFSLTLDSKPDLVSFSSSVLSKLRNASSPSPPTSSSRSCSSTSAVSVDRLTLANSTSSKDSIIRFTLATHPPQLIPPTSNTTYRRWWSASRTLSPPLILRLAPSPDRRAKLTPPAAPKRNPTANPRRKRAPSGLARAPFRARIASLPTGRFPASRHGLFSMDSFE